MKSQIWIIPRFSPAYFLHALGVNPLFDLVVCTGFRSGGCISSLEATSKRGYVRVRVINFAFRIAILDLLPT